MSRDITKLSDIIEPVIFNDYVLQEIVDKMAIIQSGIASGDPNLVIPRGGTEINLPFWKNLDGESEVMSDTTPMNISKISASADKAAIHLRWHGWGANDLASIVSGSDAMTAVAEKVADWWRNEYQKVLLKSIDGVFKSSGMADSVLDISGTDDATGVISADAILDAMYLLGDSYTSLTGILMHSMVQKKLAKLDLIDYEKDSNGNPTIPFYMGKRVIVDDALTPATVLSTKKAYPIYFFGQGAISYNEGQDVVNVEFDRDVELGEDIMATRRQFIMHPRGVKWKGTPAGVTPSNTELESGDNWELVEDRKNVAITKLVARLT